MWWYTPVIPATQETEMRRTEVQGQPGQKFNETPISKNKLGKIDHTYNSSYVGGISRRTVIQGYP
jgi:hypothetical protein